MFKINILATCVEIFYENSLYIIVIETLASNDSFKSTNEHYEALDREQIKNELMQIYKELGVQPPF